MENNIIKEDGNRIAESDFIEWSVLKNHTVLITGATGLIGMNLVKGIMSYNENYNGRIKVLALVRNIEKGKRLFAQYMENDCLEFVQGDILSPLKIEELVTDDTKEQKSDTAVNSTDKS